MIIQAFGKKQTKSMDFDLLAEGLRNHVFEKFMDRGVRGLHDAAIDVAHTLIARAAWRKEVSTSTYKNVSEFELQVAELLLNSFIASGTQGLKGTMMMVAAMVENLEQK